MQEQELSALGRKNRNFIEFDEQESMICEIHKHPFGLLIVWLVGFFIAVSILAVTIATWYFLGGDSLGVGTELNFIRPIIVILGFFIILLVLGATGVKAWIYQHNMLLVTSEKIAEFTYISIFNRKITQLDLSDIQDVAVEQKGILPRIFGYGTILIETAGEHENVLITYAPLPYNCAKQIVGAREIRKSGGLAATR